MWGVLHVVLLWWTGVLSTYIHCDPDKDKAVTGSYWRWMTESINEAINKNSAISLAIFSSDFSATWQVGYLDWIALNHLGSVGFCPTLRVLINPQWTTLWRVMWGLLRGLCCTRWRNVEVAAGRMCHGHVASEGFKACGLFPHTGQCSSEPSPATNVMLSFHGSAPEHQVMHSNSLAKRSILPASWAPAKWLYGAWTVMEKDTNS